MPQMANVDGFLKNIHMQNLEPSRSTWTRTSRNRSHAWKYLRNLVFCIWQPAISMLQECLSNCHPGVTIQGPKPQPTSSFVPANHFATLWNDYAYFPHIQVLKWTYTMSLAMQIKKLMISHVWMLRLSVPMVSL